VSSTREWLPTTLPAAAPIQPVTHRFDLPDGQTVIAQPFSPGDPLPIPTNLSFAVVIDRSRSMAPLAPAVNSALEDLKNFAARGNRVELYLTASPVRGEGPARISLDALDPTALTYSGGQNPAELLAQFAALRGADRYDAVFVLTDGTGYALGTGTLPALPADTPYWMIHLDGKYPLGYDDATLELIQASGGGISENVQEALDRFAVARGSTAALTADATADRVDGYVWMTLPTVQVPDRFGDLAASDQGFAPFAARRLILDNLRRERDQRQQLNTLDQLHAIARQYSVVSPYSSMLVLVNEQQHRMLDDLEKQGDRFARETEEVGDTQQNPFAVTAVPEPHEYLLIALAALGVLWYLRTTRRRAPRAH
jgi:putative PEP-CTERM system integral membrane protein